MTSIKKNIGNPNFILMFTLAGAAIVRFWGIDFGLPNTFCRPDEQYIVDIIYSPLRYFHPADFHYPSLYKYFVLFFYGLYFILGMIIGKFRSAWDLLQEFIVAPEGFYLINRFLSAFLGVATVFISYKIAEKLFDKKIALVSSLFLSFAYLHVRDSHFGTVDVPVTFLVMCSLLFVIKAYQGGALKNYIIAGIFTGLTVSTKYSGILLCIPMLIAHSFNVSAFRGRIKKIFFDKRILFFVIICVTAFLLGTPFALFDSSGFINDFLYEMKHLHYGHGGLILGRGWWYHLKFSLLFGLGPSLFFASLIGILILIKSDLKKAMILYSFPFVYYAIAGKGYTVFLRYIIPVVPFLCIAGAVCAVSIINNLAKYLSSKFYNIGLIKEMHYLKLSIPILIILPSIYNIFFFDILLTKKDNRLIAADWVNKNLPEGSFVAQNGYFGKVQLSASVDSLEEEIRKSEDRIQIRLLQFKIANLQTNNIKGFNEFKLEEIKSGLELSCLPRYIIVEESPLVLYSIITPGLKELLQKFYYPLKDFKVVNIYNSNNQFDQEDAFYLPFVGFKDIQRPGPNIYIFARNQIN